MLFVVVFGLVGMQEAVPERTKACPNTVMVATPSGDLLAGWNGGTTANVYETESMQQIASLDHPKATNVLPKKFSRNSQYLVTWVTDVSAGRETHWLYIWNMKAQQKPIIIPGDGGDQSFTFSPDSSRMAAADDYREKPSGNSQYTFSIWNVETGERLYEFVVGHRGMIVYVDWSADGSRIATASMDGTIRLWDANTGLETKCLQTDTKEGGFRMAAFSSDGKTVIGWNENDKLFSWDAETGLVKSKHDLFGHDVSFHRHSLDYDVVSRMYSAEWVEPFEKKYDKWLPDWAKRWLQKRRLRYDVYRYRSDIGSLDKLMTLPPSNMPLAILPGTQELIAFEYATDPKEGQLAWYSLDQSYAWLRPLSWAAGISFGYWLLLSLLAWRKGTRKLQRA